MKKSHAERAQDVRSSGFTLFEVLVALAIAAVGLGLLMSATGTGLANSNIAHQYVEGTRRAQSHMAELGVAVPLVAGIRSGDDGDGFAWTTRVSPPVVHNAGPTPTETRAGLYTVEVEVTWRSGAVIKSVVLRSQRIAPS